MAPKPDKKKAQQPTVIRIVNILVGRTNRREVLTFLLFVLLSFIFWVVQTAREENTSVFIVRLGIDAQPQDKVFTTHVPTELKVTITDTNAQLLRYNYSNVLDTLTINFERYADAIGNFRVSAAELQSMLRADLQGSTVINAVSPSLLDARFAMTEGRRVPVRIDGTFLPAADFRMHSMYIEPDTVVINAPKAVLDTLRYIPTQPTGHLDMRDTLIQTLSLELPIGVKATPSKVRVMIPVTQYVRKDITGIIVQGRHAPAGRELVFFPYSARITCLVDLPAYHDITADHFMVFVDGDSIGSPRYAPSQLPICVQYLGPDEVVTHIEVEPKIAEYVLESQ